MTCDEFRRYLSPYLDSELDARTSFEMARHLDGCGACRERLDAEDRLEKAIGRELRRPEPGDDALWERVRTKAERPRRRAWMAWAAGLLAAALAAGGVIRWTRGSAPSLADVLLNDYRKFQAGHSPLEIASADSGAVERFFKDRMGMALTIPPEVGPMKLEGGRKCSLRGAPAAFLAYRCRDDRVAVAIFDADHLDRFLSVGVSDDPRTDERGDVRVVTVRSGWKVVCATGTIAPRELLDLCAAYRDGRAPKR
jgi:anti-sigma factor RsiW